MGGAEEERTEAAERRKVKDAASHLAVWLKLLDMYMPAYADPLGTAPSP